MILRNIKKYLAWYKSKKLRYQILIPVLGVAIVFYIFCLPSPLFDVPYSTVVTDRNNELLGARIADDQQWRFSASDTIPEKYKVCIKQFEDKYFDYHWGINPISILRAFKQNIIQRKIVSGGSTLTMQTIRLSRKKKRTYVEKIIEIIQATRLEFSYSKDEILNLYASHAPMGGNVVGIEAAAWRYFGHDAASLSWAEAATLAVLPNSPSIMHFGRNRDKLVSKRNKLLKNLLNSTEINLVDYELAIAEPLSSKPYDLPQIAPHLVTKIYLEEGGKEVRSTIDKYIQIRVEQILMRWNAEFAQNEIKNIAAVVIDVENNEVVSYCGNVNFDKRTSANQVDILQSSRSTGSILKPFLYCSMQQSGQMLPNELLADIPININGFTPKNFSLNYDGAVHASEALARSLNIPFVTSLRKYGIPRFYNLLRKEGMTTLSRSPDTYGLSLILGGAEGKLWDISSMYAHMVQSLNDYNEDGIYKKRNSISYIYGKENKKKIGVELQPSFGAGAIWLTFDALTNVNRPEEIDWRSIPSIQKIAWKTGTSFGFRDGWAVGVTSRYVVGVWVGNSDGEGRPGLTGARTAGMVMFDIFNTLPSAPWFTKPLKDLVNVEVCKESGLLAGANCPDTSIDTILISRKGLEHKSCNYHITVNLSEGLKYRVFENCAGNKGIVNTSWFVLPASWEWFYKEQHSSYQMLPPLSPECQEQDNTKVMEFIYPANYAVISIPKQLDGNVGQVIFELAHRDSKTRVFWHLDKDYIGETENFHKKELTPSLGKHKLTVVDEYGNSEHVYFSVK